MFEDWRRDPWSGLWKQPPTGLCSILPGLGRPPLGAGKRKVGGVVVTDLGTINDTDTDATGTFAFGSFGTATADRILIGGLGALDSATIFSISSSTIGGVTAALTQHNNSTNRMAALSYAAVPTGASGSVIANWSEAINNDQSCALIGVTGLASATPIDASTGDEGADTFVIINLNAVSAGDLAVMAITKLTPAEGGSFSDNSGDGVPWVEVEDFALPDNALRLALGYKIFTVGNAGFTARFDGGATSTAFLAAAATFDAA